MTEEPKEPGEPPAGEEVPRPAEPAEAPTAEDAAPGDPPPDEPPHHLRKRLTARIEAAEVGVDRTLERITRHVPAPVRRFILSRVVLELAGIALLVLCVLALVIRTDGFREWVRRSLEAEITLELRRPVRIGDVRAALLPPRVRLLGVEITNHPAAGRDPLLAAEEVRIEAGWFPRGVRGWKLSAVTARGLTVRLRRLPDGRWNLPDPRPSETDDGSSLSIDRVRVLEGILDVSGAQMPIEGDARVAFEWLAQGSGDRHVLTLGLSKAHLRIRDGEPFEASGRLVASIEGGRYELDELTIESSLGTLSSSGRVSLGAKRGKGSLGVSGTFRAAEVDRALRLGQRMAGDVTLAGDLAWEREGPHFVGGARAPEFRLRGIVIERVRLRADVGPGSWTVSLEEAKVGRGRLSASASGQGLREVEAAVAADDLDVAPILGAFAPKWPRLESLLDADLRAKAADATLPDEWMADGSLSLRATGTGPTAIAGALKGSYTSGRFAMTQVDLEAPSVRLAGNGELRFRGKPGGRFDFGVEIPDVAATQRLLWDALPLSEAFLRAFPALAGSGRAGGFLETDGHGFRLDAQVAGDRVEAAGRPLGSVSGRLVATADTLEVDGGEAHLPDGGTVRLSGRFDQWELPQGPVAQLRVDATSFPAETALAIIRLDGIAVQGRASGHLTLNGPVLALDGGGPLTLTAMTAWGQRADRASGRLAFEAGSLSLLGLVIEAGGGRATGEAHFDADGHHFSFDASAEGVPLASIDVVRPLLPPGTGARLTARGRGRGTYEAPDLSGEGIATEPTLFGFPMGPAELDVSAGIVGGRWRLAARGPGGLDAEVEAPMKGGERAGRWRLAATSLTPYRSLLGPSRAGLGFDGRLAAEGTVDVPADGPWKATGRATAFQWAASATDLRLAEPADLVFAPDRVGFTPARFEGTFADGTLGATIRIGGGPPRIDARAVGSVDAAALSRLLPETITTAGRLDVDLRAEGELLAPTFFGTADIVAGTLKIAGLPETLERMHGRLDFRGGRLSTESVTGLFGGGSVDIACTARLDGVRPEDFRARIQLGGIPLRDVFGFDLLGRGEILASGTPDRVVLRGDIVLDRAEWTEEIELGLNELLSRSVQPVARASVDPWMDQVELELRLRAPGTVSVRNSLVRANADADLALRGTMGHPSLLGQASLVEGGEVDFQDVKYEILSGTIFFSDPFRFNPVFDINAEAEIRGYTIRMNLAGTLARFTPTFSSDPPLPEADIIYLLLAGQTLDEEDFLDADSSLETRISEATKRAVSMLTLAEVNRRGKQFFGLDRFTIDPIFDANSQIDSARLTVGKRVSKDLTVTWSYNPQAGDEQIFYIEYRLGRGTFLQGSRDADGVLAFDLKWRRRF